MNGSLPKVQVDGLTSGQHISAGKSIWDPAFVSRDAWLTCVLQHLKCSSVALRVRPTGIGCRPQLSRVVVDVVAKTAIHLQRFSPRRGFSKQALKDLPKQAIEQMNAESVRRSGNARNAVYLESATGQEPGFA